MEQVKGPEKKQIFLSNWVKVDNFIRGETSGKIIQTGNLEKFDEAKRHAEDAKAIYTLGEPRRKLT